jgi:subtilisin family serine protease
MGAILEKKLSGINVSVLRLPEPALDAVSAALAKTGLFTFIEPDYTGSVGQSASVIIPNDPDFSSQWHLSKLQMPNAWSVTEGNPGVTIALIDSGVDATHNDLASKLVPGWNFLTGTSNTSDDQGHGTAVAGAIAAATNNGIGVSGVAWMNMIMPLVVVNSSLYAQYSDLANAITYAADHGARIIITTVNGTTASSTLQSAVDYAWSKGAVLFASPGNDSTSTPYYPAACNHAIAVSATDPNDNLASFSNYGNWIELSAPGVNILTTQMGGGYWYCWGTSFSAPIAGAVGALVLSRQPSLSNSALVSLLETTSDDLGSPGFDQYFGYGRVNAYKAVAAVSGGDTTPPSVSISSPMNGSTVSGTVNVAGTASDNVGVTSIQFYVDGQLAASGNVSPFTFSWMSTAGSHTLTVNASDAAGNVGSASVTVNVSNPVPVGLVGTDTQPPAVRITQPVNGTKVSGNVQIAAVATDNVGVTQVSFYIDNVLKCTDTLAPYTCMWNARKAGAGSHVITAKAWDAAGNSASAYVTVQR